MNRRNLTFWIVKTEKKGNWKKTSDKNCKKSNQQFF